MNRKKITQQKWVILMLLLSHLSIVSKAQCDSDKTPPVFNCPLFTDAIFVLTDKNEVEVKDLPKPSVSDNCDGLIISTVVAGQPNSISDKAQINFEAMDKAGNKATCSVTYALIKKKCVDGRVCLEFSSFFYRDISEYIVVSSSNAATTQAQLPPKEVENIGGTICFDNTAPFTISLTRQGRDISQTPVLAIGSFTITPCNPCDNDVSPPVFSSCRRFFNTGPPLGDIVLLTNNDSIRFADIPLPTVMDNCDAQPTIRIIDPLSTPAFLVNYTPILYEATDQAGNKSQCRFDYRLLKRKCKEGKTCLNIPALPFQRDASEYIVVTSSGNPVARLGDIVPNTGGERCFDNKTAFTITLSRQGIDSPNISIGTFLIEPCDTCLFDKIAPVFTACPSNITQITSSNCANATWTTPTAIDNCSTPSVSTTATTLSGSCFPLGTTKIIYTATDEKNNTAICAFTITVNPTPASGLTINCPTNINITIPQSATYTNVSWQTPTASTDCKSNNNCATTSINGFSLLGELNGHQYFISNQLANWRDAKQLCINNGGYLAAITSQAENDFLKSKLNDMVFIGLNDETTEGTFEWANGEPLVYTNWALGQPAQSPQAWTEDYVVFQNWDGKWEDVNGIVAKRVLLELNCSGSGNTPPPIVEQTAGNANGGAFSIGVTTVTYKAKDACNNTQTCSFTVTVKQTTTIPPSSNYCTSKGNTPWEAWIGKVNFKQINQQSFKEGYGNFRSVAASVNTGEVVPLSITPSFSYTQYNGFVRAWIDFSGDGDFLDAGEMIINQPYIGNTPGKPIIPITGNVTIPAIAHLGTTVLRVSFKQDLAPNPCDVWSNAFGEVEDYSVVISSNFQALVTMGSLNVKLIDSKSRLDWVRRSDKVAYFEVEKSADGNNFTLLQKVWSDAFNSYHFIYDENLIEGDNFYRLKIVQSDGKVDYTLIQKVFYEKLVDFTIFPNPTNDEVWIDLKRFEGRTIDIILSDVAGKVLRHEKVEKATTAPYRLDLIDMPSGSYMVTIQTRGKRTVVRKLSIVK